MTKLRKQSKASMIDKTNPLWKWHKASKKTKEQYKKETGLEAKEVGLMTDEAYEIYMKLFTGTDEKTK